MRVVGVVPAAGYARRLGPIPVSKEVLPVGGRPVLEYVVARMRLADATEIRVVTRPEKTDVAGHARRLGAVVVEGRPASVAESIRLGLGGLGADDAVLLGFPDSVWEPADGFATLLAALAGDTQVVLGCFRSEELERSDVVVADEDGTVRAVQVKPARPAADVIWGCAVARAAALEGLREHAEPGELFRRLAESGVVRAVVLDGEFLDVGTPDALERLRAGA